MVSKTAAFVRWTPDEYAKVAANALQFIDARVELIKALYRAQKVCIPRERWRTDAEMRKIDKQGKDKGGLARFVIAARALPPDQLAALMVAEGTQEPAPDNAPKPPKSAGKLRPQMKWDEHVFAIVSKQVQQLSTMYPDRSLNWLFVKAQEVIPEGWRKTPKSLQQMEWRDQLKPLYMKGLSMAPQFAGKAPPWYVAPPPAPAVQPPALPPVSIAAATPAPAVPAAGRIPYSSIEIKPFPQRPPMTKTIWTTREKALLARSFDSIDPQSATPVRVAYAAMQIALPSDRWKPLQSFADLHTHKKLLPLLDEGRRLKWTLPADSAPAQAAALLAPAEHPRPAVSFQVPHNPENEPHEASMRGQLLETARRLADGMQAIEAAQTPQATQAPAIPSASLGAAAEAFAATMAQALEKLLQASAAATLDALDGKLSAIAQNIGNGIAAQIERGLRQTVVDTMAAELGGPVKAPAIAAAPELSSAPPAAPVPPPEPAARAAEPPPAPEPPRLPQLRVDVVGFPTPNLGHLVKQQCAKDIDFRFYDPDVAGGYSPHRGREVIMMVDRIPHRLKDKIKSAGVTPVYVKGTVGHVVHAVDELYRSFQAAQVKKAVAA